MEWERNHKENSFFLRGKDLSDAELQLAKNTSKEPYPTYLQREYVFTSKKAADRQRRIVTSISIAGVIALTALSIFGFYQSRQSANNAATAVANEQEANRQAQILRAGELAAFATLEMDKHFDLALLFGVEGLQTQETSRTMGTLLSLTDSHPNLNRYLSGHSESVNSVAFGPDGNALVSGSGDTTIILWDVRDPQAPSQLSTLQGHSNTVESVALSPDGKTLASGSDDSTIILWDMVPSSWVQKACQRAGRNFTRAEWAEYFPNEEYRKTCEQWLLELN